MPSTGFTNGPYPLVEENVAVVVSKKSSGAYALGNSKSNGFHVQYVGRSDTDLAGRLRQHIGRYDESKCGYSSSPKDAFEKECTLYHDFSPVDNKVHPGRPEDANWKCPRCSIFG